MSVPARKEQCATCIFRRDGKQLPLMPGRLAEIEAYLTKGISHDCHTSRTLACRGGRDFQLRIWHRIGILAEPTDECLASEMAATKVASE